MNRASLCKRSKKKYCFGFVGFVPRHAQVNSVLCKTLETKEKYICICRGLVAPWAKL